MIDLMEKGCFKAIFLSSTTVFHPNKRSGCQDWGGLGPLGPPSLRHWAEGRLWVQNVDHEKGKREILIKSTREERFQWLEYRLKSTRRSPAFLPFWKEMASRNKQHK